MFPIFHSFTIIELDNRYVIDAYLAIILKNNINYKIENRHKTCPTTCTSSFKNRIKIIGLVVSENICNKDFHFHIYMDGYMD